jgi:hypothetical protein
MLLLEASYHGALIACQRDPRLICSRTVQRARAGDTTDAPAAARLAAREISTRRLALARTAVRPGPARGHERRIGSSAGHRSSSEKRGTI